MNKALKLIAAAAVVALSSPVFAQATYGFSVTGTVAARCESNTAAGQVVDFGEYTAFAGSALGSVTPAVIAFRCTRGITAPTTALSGGTGTVAGLDYTLSIAGGTTATSGSNAAGNFDVYTYTISGSIAAGQAGDVAAATTDSVTLTVTY